MENEKLGQEAAFANRGNIHEPSQLGMSKRFYAACNLLPSIISSVLSTEKGIAALSKAMKEENITQSEFMVGMAYEFADELLKQENE